MGLGAIFSDNISHKDFKQAEWCIGGVLCTIHKVENEKKDVTIYVGYYWLLQGRSNQRCT